MLRNWTSLTCWLTTIALISVGCNESPTEVEETAFGPRSPTSPGAVTQQSADLFEAFGAVSDPWGTATLRRGPTGIQAQLSVTDPDVRAALIGDAITVWVASFHNPGECAAAPDICGPGDLGNPDVEAALQRGTGRVLGNGPINLALNVREGDDSEQIAGTSVGLVDAADEIHLVIRTHGAPIPGKVADQISTPAGACKTVNGNPGPDPAGNDCVDVAVAIFR